MPDGTKAAQRHSATAKADAWGSLYGPLLEGPQHAWARWLQGMFAVSQEITQFTQHRLQEDMAAWTALATCHNPEETMTYQRRFAENATTQYAEEINKLSQMMMSIAGESFPAVQHKPTVTS
jgi:hypothetical protein